MGLLSHPGPQDVTFLSIEEVTLHHNDVARQHPHSARFPFDDNVTMSDFSQQVMKGENLVDFWMKTIQVFANNTLKAH